MSDFDLVVIGEINPDLILQGADLTPAFGQAEKLVAEATLTVGSSAVIMASGAARLGLRTAFVGVVGEDHFGRFMLEAMEEHGIDTTACVIAPSLSTGVSVILVHADDRAILTYPGAIPTLRPDQVDRVLLQHTRHVHCGSYFLLRQLQAGLAEIFATAQAAGASTSLDTNWDPSGRWNGGLKQLFAHCDLFLPNAAEAMCIAGRDALDEALDVLAAQVPTLAVKLGAAGALARRGDQIVRQQAFPVTVVDAVGAGDSFDAGLLYGYLQGWSLSDSLRLATACGSLSTRAAGGTAAQPSLEEARRVAGLMPAAGQYTKENPGDA